MFSSTSLKSLHTFGVDVQAHRFFAVPHEEALQRILPLQEPVHILGGGSNILFTAAVERLILHNQIKGIECIAEDDTQVTLRVGGGEIWQEFVDYCVDRGWAGIENLALIPGTVGAAPVQNIGAYGVEFESVFKSLEAIELSTGKTVQFTHADCAFGYRDSIFKRAAKDKFFITRVYIQLHKKAQVNTNYGRLQDTLAAMQVKDITVASVRDAVVAIRRQKLPAPEKIGNAGSFFKNPILSLQAFARLKAKHPAVPHYAAETGVKIPAAWLIEQAGWKGFREGDAGVYPQHALILVNYGAASGQALWQLAQQIIADVATKFDITLQPEVNIW